jgi:hypothetical protein
MTHDTIVEGKLKGKEGIKIVAERENAIEEKLERFEKGLDTLDGIIDKAP